MTRPCPDCDGDGWRLHWGEWWDLPLPCDCCLGTGEINEEGEDDARD